MNGQNIDAKQNRLLRDDKTEPKAAQTCMKGWYDKDTVKRNFDPVSIC